MTVILMLANHLFLHALLFASMQKGNYRNILHVNNLSAFNSSSTIPSDWLQLKQRDLFLFVVVNFQLQKVLCAMFVNNTYRSVKNDYMLTQVMLLITLTLVNVILFPFILKLNFAHSLITST